MNRISMVALAVLAVASMTVVGCREHMPHSFTLGTGDLVPTHPKPAEGGYYTNWDPYAATVTLEPAKDVNPVNTQHILIATVLDKEGKPLPNRRVEWMVAEGGVGDIVEVDESGWRASRGWKQTNKFAISHTNNFEHVLDRGNDDPSDDIHLKPGQTWCVITSPVEGTSHVIAYVPGIYNWEKHKAFAKKHWYDVAWEFPPAATNRIGTPHKLVTKVWAYSDKSPLSGYEVTYTLLGGPAGSINGQNKIAVMTDANGEAVATLNQSTPMEGVNDIQVDIRRPGNEKCCIPPVDLATGMTKKVWVGPKIAITKDAPARAEVADQFNYTINVSNPGEVAALDAVVTDPLPDGIKYVSSSPAGNVNGNTLTVSLGDIAPQETKTITVTVEATRTGTFTNCAEVKAKDGLQAKDCAETVVVAPALALKKEAPAEVLICEMIPYKVTVTNTGEAPARNIKFVDNLPEGLTYKGAGVVESTIPVLNPGEAQEIVYDVKATRPGTFKNTGKVTADRGLMAEASAQTVVRQPVLVVNKTAPQMRYLNTEIKYTITVSNSGDGVARGTRLMDTVPAGTAFVSASDGGQLSGGQVQWDLGDLAPSASKQVTVVLRATQVGSAENTAQATAQCAEASTTATTTIEGVPAILLECVDEADPIEIGGVETYTIRVTNQGSATDKNVTVIAELPPEMDYVDASGPSQATVDGKKVSFAPVEALPAGQVIIFTVKGKATTTNDKATADVRFKVILTSDMMTSPAQETESTHIYE